MANSGIEATLPTDYQVSSTPEHVGIGLFCGNDLSELFHTYSDGACVDRRNVAYHYPDLVPYAGTISGE
jgi:hypothetical protein